MRTRTLVEYLLQLGLVIGLLVTVTVVSFRAQTTQAVKKVVVGSILELQLQIAALPGAFTSYRNRAAFEAAAGATTDVDFEQLPPSPPDFLHTALTLDGATFNKVFARGRAGAFAPFIFRQFVPHNPILVDLPAGAGTRSGLMGYYAPGELG